MELDLRWWFMRWGVVDTSVCQDKIKQMEKEQSKAMELHPIETITIYIMIGSMEKTDVRVGYRIDLGMCQPKWK